MAKILTHTDDDGDCAAAVAISMILPTGIGIGESDISRYCHRGTISIPDFAEGEYVIVTDLAMDDNVFKYIKTAVKHNCKVLHIDHHKTTLDYIAKIKPGSYHDRIFNKIKTFYDTRYSASLLAYIYASLPEEIKDAFDHFDNSIVPFESDALYENFFIQYKDYAGFPYQIPKIITYVNDHDTSGPYDHVHQAMTTNFHYGFTLENKSPLNRELWDNALYDYTGICYTDKIIENGALLVEYTSRQADRNAKSNAFEFTIFGNTCICINDIGGSDVIGPTKYDEYALICVYHYTGFLWRYSIYNNTKIKKIDVSKIARFFKGGGHAAAAGFTSKFNLFSTANGGRKETKLMMNMTYEELEKAVDK